MPRASGGDYTLAAGNPVVTATPITPAWANGTLNDLATAMTDSLSRSGDGGMLAALELDSGTVGAPGLTFGAETSLGLYRVSAGLLGVAAGATQLAVFSSTGLTVATGVVSNTLGTAGAPSYSFTGDLNTGMSAATADTLVLSTAGTARLTISSVGATFGPVLLGPVGSESAPTYSFTGDSNTGMSSALADTLVLSTGGSARLTLTAAAATVASTQIIGVAGTAGTPTYSFSGDTNTGMSAEVNDNLVLSTGGTARLTITTVLTSAINWRGPAGTNTAPSITFSGDTNTGFYSDTADELMFTEGGGSGFRVGFRNIPQRILNTTGNTVLGDIGKHIYKASGGAGETITIDGTLAYGIGDSITFINQGGGTLTIAISTDTMTMIGTGSTGSRTLADDGMATAIKVTSGAWVISGTGLS